MRDEFAGTVYHCYAVDAVVDIKTVDDGIYLRPALFTTAAVTVRLIVSSKSDIQQPGQLASSAPAICNFDYWFTTYRGYSFLLCSWTNYIATEKIKRKKKEEEKKKKKMNKKDNQDNDDSKGGQKGSRKR